MDDTKIIYKIIRRRTARKRELEARPFDSSAIGDLAFLLLIFFIVTSSFILRQGIFFSLPSRSSGSVKLDDKKIVEVLPQNSGFIYEGENVDRDEFKEQLVKHKEKEPRGVLIIKMGMDVKYDRLVDTMSVAREAGLVRISLKNIE